VPVSLRLSIVTARSYQCLRPAEQRRGAIEISLCTKTSGKCKVLLADDRELPVETVKLNKQ